ncbi:CBS domain-containing protein [Tuwongella immobilis]|uniref:CBS domain-containing protein n=1 Tax=Tuwongella immobilis TaxID=692036 RepID=A0A6C2YMH5_9BACT|nr:CBS domain-containing protein [Tuwongella immobilis]VIP02323.1 CBS domain containing protein OS=uncultured Acidobacteria bacterium GN=HGMM_F54F02C39 PE=4 SV=1: CBS: CBS [Tuwongella immobilis]VTS01055.1 CBS domain containing protein OS=uncultured Acidobacteria bacterium GN=HGMM_F54F02C39 PE=4 SV=1: CBS: CBS [Tuwongella immobilis]
MELSRNLRVDSVSRLDPTPPRIVPHTATVADAVAQMRTKRVGCLVVCQQDRMIGIFTERDLMTRVVGTHRGLQVGITEVMTPDPVCVSPQDSIRVAIERMQSGGYRHLPVVIASHQPIGILSVKRIVHYLVEHFPGTIYNLPPDPGVVPREREGA